MRFCIVHSRHCLLFWGQILVVLLLTACGVEEQLASTLLVLEPTQDYRSPTVAMETPSMILLPSATPTQFPRTELPLPSTTPDCEDALRFLEDLTIPDGSRMIAGNPVDKRWRVENAGSCNWDGGYRLRLLGGIAMGVPVEQALYPARAGAQAVIRILFTAPAKPGTYRSAWQAVNPAGEAFGDPFYIEIQVYTQP